MRCAFVLALAACTVPGPTDRIIVGEPVPKGQSIALTEVVAHPDAYAGKPVLVDGKVRAVCRKRGCWMEITPEQAATPSVRVRFKDYGFFVPTTSTGNVVRLSGEVTTRTMAPDEVAHLQGEGATIAKADDGSARAVEITATGVELTRL